MGKWNAFKPSSITSPPSLSGKRMLHAKYVHTKSIFNSLAISKIINLFLRHKYTVVHKRKHVLSHI